MQISNLVNQYNNNLASGGEISTKSQGVEQLVSTVQKLTAGQVFEGTVNSVKGNTVILGLSSGQNITATLAKDILLEQGQSVFFQVKSNDGNTIQIKPISNNAMNNPTLLNALDSANLAVNERNVNMVNNMMREQMPIDSNSLNEMARVVNTNSNIDVATIIQMSKLGIEVNPQLASQFENYKANQASVMNMISELSSAIPDMLASEELSYTEASALNREIINILADEPVSVANSSKESDMLATLATNSKGEAILASLSEENGVTTTTNNANTNNSVPGAALSEAELVSNNSTDGKANIGKGIDSFIQQVNNSADNPQPNSQNVSNQVNSQTANIPTNNTQVIDAEGNARPMTGLDINTTYNQESYPRNSIGNTLTESQYKALNEMIKNDTDFLNNNSKFIDENGNINPKANVTDFMKGLANYIENVNVSRTMIKNLFGSDSYKALINNMTEQQWTLDPADVAKGDPVKRLYEKLEMGMRQLEQVTAQMNKVNSQVSKATSEIRSNIDFMNQVNQNFTYVQLPIRMSSQNTNSELYVYKNKMNKSEDDEISAFLHFDMDHLGSTDISVKLHNRNVDTKFYMEDDASYDLIMNNVDILQKRIEKKGYTCNINVENESKKVNLVEDFLKHDTRGTTTPVSRYSFDVRA